MLTGKRCGSPRTPHLCVCNNEIGSTLFIMNGLEQAVAEIGESPVLVRRGGEVASLILDRRATLIWKAVLGSGLKVGPFYQDLKA